MKSASLLVLLALVGGLLAGQASAGMFTLNHDAAMMLTEISHDPTGSKIYSRLYTVTDDPAEYDSTGGMRGVVGYVGLLDAAKTPKDAWMRIGASATTPKDAGDVIGAVLGGHTHDLSGYTTYNLFLANDDNSDWWVRLFIATDSNPVYTSGSILLPAGESTTLTRDLIGVPNLNNVTAIGFDIGGLLNNVIPNPSDPDVFHVSAVPVPTGVLLGFLGLSAAGLGLRKLS